MGWEEFVIMSLLAFGGIIATIIVTQDIATGLLMAMFILLYYQSFAMRRVDVSLKRLLHLLTGEDDSLRPELRGTVQRVLRTLEDIAREELAMVRKGDEGE